MTQAYSGIGDFLAMGTWIMLASIRSSVQKCLKPGHMVDAVIYGLQYPPDGTPPFTQPVEYVQIDIRGNPTPEDLVGYQCGASLDMRVSLRFRAAPPPYVGR